MIVPAPKRLRLDPRVVVDKRREVALDLPRRPVAAGGLCGQDDLERVPRVLRASDRPAAALDAVDEVSETVGPLPLRIGIRVDPPRSLGVAPQLPAFGCPIVSEELNGAGIAVQLDRGRAVLLHRE